GGDLLLLDLARGEVVGEGDARDVGKRVGIGDAKCAPADDERELRFIVQSGDALRPDYTRIVADHDRGELDEAGRLLGHLLDQVVALELVEVRLVVLAHAEEETRVGDGREQPYPIARDTSTPARARVQGAASNRHAGLT